MPNPDSRSPQYQQHPISPSRADSGGTRSSSGSNYGDWRPDNAEPLDTFAFRAKGGRASEGTEPRAEGPTPDLFSSTAPEASAGQSQDNPLALNVDAHRWIEGQMHELDAAYRHWRQAQEQQLVRAFSLWRQAHPEATGKAEADRSRSAQPGSADPGSADACPDDENGHGVIAAGPASRGEKPDGR